MPRLTTRKKKNYKKAYYENNKDEIKQARKKAYEVDPSKKLEAQNKAYEADTSKKLEAQKKAYEADPSKKLEAQKKAYEADPSKKLEAQKKAYEADPRKKLEAQKKAYEADPSKKLEAQKKAYEADPSKKLGAQKKAYEADPRKKLEAQKKAYEADPSKKLEAQKKDYEADPSKKLGAQKKAYEADPSKKLSAEKERYQRNKALQKHSMQEYYRKCRSRLLLNKQKGYYRSGLSKRAAKLLRRAIVSKKPKMASRSYSLHEPKQHVVELYVKNMKLKVLKNGSIANDLFSAFQASVMKSFGEKRKSKKLTNALCNIAVRKVVSKALEKRKESVGHFLASVRKVNALQISVDDFGDCFHTASSELYFYDQSYANGQTRKATISVDEQGMRVVEREVWVWEPRNTPIPVDEQGRCVLAQEMGQRDPETHRPSKWKCTSECKHLTTEEKQRIVDLKSIFASMRTLRQALDAVDSGCQNGHYTCKATGVDLAGHPLMCTIAGCESKLRTLRAAAPHYPVLRMLLAGLYESIRYHKFIAGIDSALRTGKFASLALLCRFRDYRKLFSSDLTGEASVARPSVDIQKPNMPDIESELCIKHANMIAELKKKLADDPEFACCSCERLLQRKNVTAFDFSESKKFTSSMWEVLRAYMYMSDPEAPNKTHYVCQYCRPILNRDQLPSRCVLNGLEVEPVPKELESLDPLSKQLIQKAKAFQAVYRLGTYTGKVPSHNSLKACKGTMFFLPLPLEKTVKTLEEVSQNADGAAVTRLPNPELFIIVNSKSKTNKVVWQSLIDICALRDALRKLKDINWVYADIDEASLDDAARRIIECVSDTSSTMLHKVSDDDVSSYQSYTIRRLDQKEPNIPDTDQYKLSNVKEDALSNKLKHLDVMCFPTLFPSGRFGEGYERDVKLTSSEYVKSRLLHKDDRFRKDDQYVFYLLWQKEMGQLAAGVCNLLEGTRQHAMPVGEFMDRVSNSDEHIEGSLSTVFQSVRGSKQFWFLRRSEVICMVREYGPPTLFLTLSCAEYDSLEIATYLRKVNNVSDSYLIGKLCTEDPISVSRKFSQKFHDFFRTVILNGKALGTVAHYFFKE